MTTPVSRNMAGHLVGGRYMLLSMIAKGGMGEVWKARDQRTGQIVAAKVLRPELSGEALPLNRLRLEAQNTLLIEHPNIAAVFDSGEDDGRGWLIMELVDGRPLTDYLRGGNRIAPRELVPLLIQISMALDAAGSAGVVHRDIKPANVLVRPNGAVKLTDFGISRTKNQVDLTQAGMVMGTAQYLPPEQALGDPATSVGDLYSVGVIAYEACAGKRPFTGKSQVDIAFAHVHESVPPLPQDVPAELAAIIYHLLEKEPHKRPQTGRELVRELVDVAQELGLPISATALTLPASAPQAAAAPTRAQPVVPPVHHTPVRTLPDEMLQRPNLDEARLDVLVPERPAPPRRFHPVSAQSVHPPQRTPATPTFPAAPAPAAAVQPAPAHPGAPQHAMPQRRSLRSEEIPSRLARSQGPRPTPGTPQPAPARAAAPAPARPAPAASARTAPHPVAGRRWHTLDTRVAQPFAQPARNWSRFAYSRSVVAPKATAYRRKVGWILGILLLMAFLVATYGLAKFALGVNLPIPFLGNSHGIFEFPPSGSSAGLVIDQEAFHV